MEMQVLNRLNDDLRDTIAYFKAHFKTTETAGEWAVVGHDGRVVYILTFGPDMTYVCTCPGFRYMHVCKHGELIRLLDHYNLIKAPPIKEKPLILTRRHRDILGWLATLGATAPGGSITCRTLIDKMRIRGSKLADRTFSARVSELYTHKYLNVIEAVLRADRLPQNAHYYMTPLGLAVVDIER